MQRWLGKCARATHAVSSNERGGGARKLCVAEKSARRSLNERVVDCFIDRIRAALRMDATQTVSFVGRKTQQAQLSAHLFSAPSFVANES